jgi:glycosyltransferase involved in cell wall biosynthesis
MTRLLYILPGPVPPSPNPIHDKFYHLSEVSEGHVLLPVWWDSPEAVSPFLRARFPEHRVGRFSYHLFLMHRFPTIFRRLATLIFYIQSGLKLHREKNFDFIMTYGTNLPAIAGLVLKWLTGAKLIVEVPGVPEDAFRYEEPHPGALAATKRVFADCLLVMTCAAADCMKLLYPSQVDCYPRLRRKKAAIFHDFVPVCVVRAEESGDPFILLVGYPWYRKGAYVLIPAFRRIAADVPNYKLKLLGYYPDRKHLDKLAAGCPQIEFLPPRPNEEALKVIGACSVFVLASRSEAMGRVLLEAMAARKPIVASAVGGVPYYIQHNDNGLLFQSESVEELAETLWRLLKDSQLQARLAKRGYEKVFAEYDERAYVRSFREMLESLDSQPMERDLAERQTENAEAATVVRR